MLRRSVIGLASAVAFAVGCGSDSDKPPDAVKIGTRFAGIYPVGMQMSNGNPAWNSGLKTPSGYEYESPGRVNSQVNQAAKIWSLYCAISLYRPGTITSDVVEIKGYHPEGYQIWLGDNFYDHMTVNADAVRAHRAGTPGVPRFSNGTGLHLFFTATWMEYLENQGFYVARPAGGTTPVRPDDDKRNQNAAVVVPSGWPQDGSTEYYTASAHEIGHMLGLDDRKTDAEKDYLMYQYLLSPPGTLLTGSVGPDTQVEPDPSTTECGKARDRGLRWGFFDP